MLYENIFAVLKMRVRVCVNSQVFPRVTQMV